MCEKHHTETSIVARFAPCLYHLCSFPPDLHLSCFKGLKYRGVNLGLPRNMEFLLLKNTFFACEGNIVFEYGKGI